MSETLKKRPDFADLGSQRAFDAGELAFAGTVNATRSIARQIVARLAEERLLQLGQCSIRLLIDHDMSSARPPRQLGND